MDRRTHRRNARGSALVESAAFLVVCISVCVALLAIVIAAGYAHNYNMKIQNVAQIAARAIVADTFWEGMQRGPKPAALSSSQTQMVSNVLQTMGLPSSTNDWSAVVYDDGFNCVVTLRVSALRLFGLPGLIPSSLALSSTAGSPWSIGHPRFNVCTATTIGQVYVLAYPPPPAGLASYGSVGAPPQTRDNPAWMDGNGYQSGIFVFNQGNLPGSGYKQYSVNYDGYGVSSPSGAATDTGANLCCFFPYQSNTGPVPPPPVGAYPSP